MDEKLKKDILRILRDTKAHKDFYDLKQDLINKYNYSDGTIIGGLHDQVLHIMRVLQGESKIDINQVESFLPGGQPITYFELTAKGYQEFNPWYKKFWDFLNNDFAKLLSLISIILSIIATWLSFHNK